jgi:predicted nucleic acid-binding protein
MSDSAFFDTNILIYAVSEDVRADRAEALLASGGVVSVQVLNEFVSVARRKLGMSWDTVESALAAVRVLCPRVPAVTLETHQIATKLARQHALGIYDALIVASALLSGCETLYSEDLQAGRVFEKKLTVVNPFA